VVLYPDLFLPPSYASSFKLERLLSGVLGLTTMAKNVSPSSLSNSCWDDKQLRVHYMVLLVSFVWTKPILRRQIIPTPLQLSLLCVKYNRPDKIFGPEKLEIKTCNFLFAVLIRSLEPQSSHLYLPTSTSSQSTLSGAPILMFLRLYWRIKSTVLGASEV